MGHSDYPLQALLYAVVLHRFLRWRQPGYDPAVHLGGVLYLYLRGCAVPGHRSSTGIRAGCSPGIRRWRWSRRSPTCSTGRAERSRACRSYDGGRRAQPKGRRGMTELFEITEPFDRRLALGATGMLRDFNQAGVLTAADVHVARRLGDHG